MKRTTSHLTNYLPTPCSLVLLLTFFLLLSSCAYDEAYRYYLTEKLPAKNIEEVEVLYDKPAQDFDVIADFQAKRMSENYMRKMAAKLGADAVIITHLGGYYSTTENWAGSDAFRSGRGTTQERITGTAIVYR